MISYVLGIFYCISTDFGDVILKSGSFGTDLMSFGFFLCIWVDLTGTS